MRGATAAVIGLVVVMAMGAGGPATAWADNGPATVRADDDRATVLAAAGGLGLGAGADSDALLPDGLALARVVVAWAVAPPAIPAHRGSTWRGGLSPEFVAGIADTGDGPQRLLLAGARWEAGFAQRELGMLGISARGNLWLAARLGAIRIDDDHQPAGELSLGYSIQAGDSPLLIGSDLGVITWRQMRARPSAGADVPAGAAPDAMTGTPLTMEPGRFLGFHLGVFVGLAL